MGRPVTVKIPCACGCGVLSAVRGYARPCYMRARMSGVLDTRPAGSTRPTTCTVRTGCDGAYWALDMCHKHYRRALRRARWTMSE